jgi:hypothetical protein
MARCFGPRRQATHVTKSVGSKSFPGLGILTGKLMLPESMPPPAKNRARMTAEAARHIEQPAANNIHRSFGPGRRWIDPRTRTGLMKITRRADVP